MKLNLQIDDKLSAYKLPKREKDVFYCKKLGENIVEVKCSIYMTNWGHETGKKVGIEAGENNSGGRIGNRGII